MNVGKVGSKLKTIGTAHLKTISYAAVSMLFEWQTQHFIQTVSCQAAVSVITIKYFWLLQKSTAVPPLQKSLWQPCKQFVCHVLNRIRGFLFTCVHTNLFHHASKLFVVYIQGRVKASLKSVASARTIFLRDL